MKENPREELEKEILALATRFSLTRIKIHSINFDLDYQRKKDGALYLVSEKAVIRAMGKTTKVPIGENERFSTYEQAFEATKIRWSEYYKKVREKNIPKAKRADARRQKRYREKRKSQTVEFKRRTK